MAFRVLATTVDTLKTDNHDDLAVRSVIDTLGVTLEFGKSFTLRLDQEALEELRSIIHDITVRRIEYSDYDPEVER
tara:strand:- start:510 stop:737 length:228 start_codon:yes stop_codon:yes gene_type:complete